MEFNFGGKKIDEDIEFIVKGEPLTNVNVQYKIHVSKGKDSEGNTHSLCIVFLKIINKEYNGIMPCDEAFEIIKKKMDTIKKQLVEKGYEIGLCTIEKDWGNCNFHYSEPVKTG